MPKLARGTFGVSTCIWPHGAIVSSSRAPIAERNDEVVRCEVCRQNARHLVSQATSCRIAGVRLLGTVKIDV